MSLTLPRWFSSRKSLLNKSANNAAADNCEDSGAGDYRSLERGRKGANGGASALALPPPPPPPPPPPLMAPTYENVECGSFRVADRSGANAADAPDTPAHRATTHEDILRARQTLKLRKSTSAGQVSQGSVRNSRREGHREFLNLASRAKSSSSSSSRKGPSGGLSHRSPSDALPSTPDEALHRQRRSRPSAVANSEGDDCCEEDEDWGEGASILSELGVAGCGEDEAFWPSPPPPPVPPPPKTRPRGLNLNFDVREEEEEQPEDEYVLFEGAIPAQESLAPKEENEEEFRCWPSNGPSFTPPPLPETAATTAPETAPVTAPEMAFSTAEPESSGISKHPKIEEVKPPFAHPEKLFPFSFRWRC